MTDGRGQRTEVGGQRAEYRGQMTEDRGRRMGDRFVAIQIRVPLIEESSAKIDKSQRSRYGDKERQGSESI